MRIKFLAITAVLVTAILCFALPQASFAENGGAIWCHTFTSNIEQGDLGDEVRALQIALNKEGLYSGEIDGKFFKGGALESAVKAFQENNASEILVPYGLTKGTGKVAASTRKKLNALYGCNLTQWCHTFTSAINQGDLGDEVRALQTALNKEGLYSGEIDGKFFKGGALESAVKAFQKKNKINQVGYVGPITREKLNAFYGCAPVATTCTSFTYSNWSKCDSSRIQTRTITKSSPAGCTGGTPDILSRTCTPTQLSVDLKANGSDGPVTIKKGDALTLSWTVANAVSCSSDWGGEASETGGNTPFVSSLMPATQTFKITCVNSSGTSVSDRVKVDVVSVSIQITNPTSTAKSAITWTAGQKYNITWEETLLDDAVFSIAFGQMSGPLTFISNNTPALLKSYPWTIDSSISPGTYVLFIGQYDSVLGRFVDDKYTTSGTINIVAPPVTPAVTVFKNINYDGNSQGYGVGSYTLSQMNAKGTLNDSISSVKVNSGYKVTFYQDYNFGGASIVKTADDSTLYNDGWNDRISSMKVEVTAGICKAEGESIPVIANPPVCCSGLTAIRPMIANITGSAGICTAKCGNGTCDSVTETNYNCPQDCTVSQPSITVTSPNGGESWKVGEAYNITWESSGVENVDITAFNMASNNLYVVANAIPAYLKTANWTVGNNLGGSITPVGNYIIKIVDHTNSQVFDTSDNYFTIVMPVCNQNWTCTAWSTCTNSQQTRTCSDSNNCGITTEKPAESQACMINCTDTDNGKDYFTKGIVVDSSPMAIAIFGAPKTLTDLCYTADKRIFEYYCDAALGYSQGEWHDCPYGCSNGACNMTASLAPSGGSVASENLIASIAASLANITAQLKSFLVGR